jgi:RNA polymerase sigma-70 factor (ECF subfamily)
VTVAAAARSPSSRRPTSASVVPGAPADHSLVDPDALVEAAYARYRPELLAVMTSVTFDSDEAEDLVQEAFLRLIREVRVGRTPTNVRAWLYRVALNLRVSNGRHASVVRRWAARTLTEEPAAPSPEAEALDDEGLEDIESALERLSRDARIGLLLRASGYSSAEVASLIGRTDLATRSLLYRARTDLRSRVGDLRPDGPDSYNAERDRARE